MRYLARAQERDLRRTISDYESPFEDSFRSRLLGAQTDIEEMYRVKVAQVDLGLEAEIPVPETVAEDWKGRVLIDWGPGGQSWLPDLVYGRTARPWDLAVLVYDSQHFKVLGPDWTEMPLRPRASPPAACWLPSRPTTRAATTDSSSWLPRRPPDRHRQGQPDAARQHRGADRQAGDDPAHPAG